MTTNATGTDRVSLRTSPALSLAVLKVNSDKLGTDLIEQFVPFVGECLRANPTTAVSAVDVQAQLHESFGLQLPIGALRVVLQRCAKRGLVRRTNNIYEPDAEAIAALPNLSVERQQALREQNALYARLCTFAERYYEVVWTAAYAEDLLLRFVALRAAPLLEVTIEGAPIVSMRTATAGGDEQIVEAFVVYLYENDPVGYGYLASLTKGSVLASALYLDADIGNAGRSFNKVTFYIDAPILVRALGFCPPAQAGAARELFNLLTADGARLACFTHSLKEIDGILDRARQTVADPRRHSATCGETTLHFLESGVSASDIAEYQDSLRERIGNLGIYIRDKPETTRDNSVDESALEKALTPLYKNPGPVLADVESLTAIHRLRGASAERRLEDAGAVFVTSNQGLARTANEFFRAEVGRHTAPLALADHVLATLAWLKRPGHAPDLPAKLVVADCYAALCPPDDTWPAYIAQLRKLVDERVISEPEYQVLRHDHQVRALLVHQSKTTGEPFAEGDIKHVLGVARATIAADKDAAARAAEAERDQAKQAAAAASAYAADMQRTAEQERRAREDEARVSQQQLEKANAKPEEDDERLAGYLARGAVRVLAAALVLLGVAYQFFAAPKPFTIGATATAPGWVKWPVFGLTLMGLLLAAAVAGGLDLKLGLARLERWLQQRLLRFIQGLRNRARQHG
jgi:hypothetical protein